MTAIKDILVMLLSWDFDVYLLSACIYQTRSHFQRNGSEIHPRNQNRFIMQHTTAISKETKLLKWKFQNDETF